MYLPVLGRYIRSTCSSVNFARMAFLPALRMMDKGTLFGIHTYSHTLWDCLLSDEAMRRVPDAGLSNGSLAFLLQVRDAAELHGRVTSYNFSHFTSYGLARPPAHSPQDQTPLNCQTLIFGRRLKSLFPNPSLIPSSFRICSVATGFNPGSGTLPNYYPLEYASFTLPINAI